MRENNQTLHVFDADRTLIDTDQVFLFLVDSLVKKGYDTSSLILAERNAKEAGGFI